MIYLSIIQERKGGDNKAQQQHNRRGGAHSLNCSGNLSAKGHQINYGSHTMYGARIRPSMSPTPTPIASMVAQSQGAPPPSIPSSIKRKPASRRGATAGAAGLALRRCWRRRRSMSLNSDSRYSCSVIMDTYTTYNHTTVN
jgi:hypothetical protein